MSLRTIASEVFSLQSLRVSKVDCRFTKSVRSLFLQDRFFKERVAALDQRRFFTEKMDLEIIEKSKTSVTASQIFLRQNLDEYRKWLCGSRLKPRDSQKLHYRSISTENLKEQPSQLTHGEQSDWENIKGALFQSGYSDEEIQCIYAQMPSNSEKSKLGLTFLTNHLFKKIISSFSLDKWRALDKNFLAKLRDSRGLSLLQAAVKDGSEECVMAILEVSKGSNLLHTLDAKKRSILHIAAIVGKSSLVEPLSRYIPLNDKDEDGLTPLHWAIHQKQAPTVKSLIDAGASLIDPWVLSDRTHIFPLSMAVAAGNPDVLDIFLKEDNLKQINLHQSTPHVGTILHIAIQANQAPMLDHILRTQHQQAKTLIEQRDSFGRTPLQLAAFLGDLHAINLLHTHGVALNSGNNEKNGTAVHFAALGGHHEVIQLLDYLGAELLALNSEGESAITCIIAKKMEPKYKECIALLQKLPNLAKKDKTQPPDFIRRPPENLVFEGGGPKGIAYVGALSELENLGCMSKVRRLAGTSAGAITASLIAVGYKSNELELHLKRDFIEFLDTQGELEKTFLEVALTGSKTALLKGLLKEYWHGWTTLLQPIERGKQLFLRLKEMTGLCKGEEVRLWVEKLIQEATGKTNCTFGELELLIRQDPSKYKELHLFSIKIQNNHQPDIVRFSHENPQWKDLIISDAVRASLSIPGVFLPHKLHFKESSGVRHPREHHGEFIDGGLIKNFPLDAFDEYRYQEDPHYRGIKTNRRTLGFSLKVENPSLSTAQIEQIHSSPELIRALINTVWHAEEILRRAQSHEQDRIVEILITDKNVTLTNFGVTEEQKQVMVKAGKEAASFFLTPSKS